MWLSVTGEAPQQLLCYSKQPQPQRFVIKSSTKHLWFHCIICTLHPPWPTSSNTMLPLSGNDLLPQTRRPLNQETSCVPRSPRKISCKEDLARLPRSTKTELKHAGGVSREEPEVCAFPEKLNSPANCSCPHTLGPWQTHGRSSPEGTWRELR